MKRVWWSWLLFAIGICSQSVIYGQHQIASDVYAWKEAAVEKTETGSKRTIIEGRATDFERMELTATTLAKAQGEAGTSDAGFEEMIVIKDGSLQVALNGKSRTIGRGSVVIVLPGDEHSYTNAADGETTYFVLRYKSRQPADIERGRKSGGSFIMDWDDVKFSPRGDGKGGTRNFFAKPTAMGKRLELHSTLLDPSQNSHVPHRHRAEELVIILDAEVEMYLGPGEKDGKARKATNGDIIYLVSNEYHAISNVGTKPALYFAFQFE